MKRILWIFIVTLCLFTLSSCKNYDETKILEDSRYEYYLSSYGNKWKVEEKYKMTPTNLGNSLVANSIPEDRKENIKHLYYGTINLNRNAVENIRYNEYEVNEGLAFEIVRTSDVSDEATYMKIPSIGCYYEALTPDTIYPYNKLEITTGAASKIAGKLNIIMVEYNKKVGKSRYGIAIVKLSDEEENQDTNIPYDEIYDSNNKQDITPTSNLASNIQDGVILHAWNWSYKNIEKSLNDIVNAGYSAVQVSPVQQPKDYSETYGKGWAQQWWKFYQPVSYSIASKSWLGTKDEFKSMCEKAESLGVKIIVDVVANHSASKTIGKEDDPNTLSDEVKKYEPDLYNNSSKYTRPTHLFAADYSVEAVVRGHLGMPELNTADKFVQNMILDLLKECIDCGADGFRFDAAKHIETPDDGSFASDFWPTIINGATSYASSKGVEIYCYGEILNTCGTGRNFSSYTKYMSITDNATGDGIRTAVNSGNASGAARSTYATGMPAEKLVLWAESHDTYANDKGESIGVSQANINKTWALVAARKGATALYFARPGEIGSIGTYNWKDISVSKINQFHNDFVGADEKVYNSGNYAVVERYKDNDCGIVIVNCNGTSSSVNINVTNLSNGQYIDAITGNTFTVNGNTLTGQMGETGIVVLNSKSNEKAPIINISQKGGFFSNSLSLTIDITFGTKARVIIGDKVEYITEKTTFNISDEVNNLDTIKVEVSAINDKYRVTEKYEFVRIDGINQNCIVVDNVPDEYLSADKYDLYAWVWQSGKDGSPIKVQIKGQYIIFEVKDNINNFLLAVVPKGATFNKTNWKNVKFKTCDFIRAENGIYSADSAKWVPHIEA